MWVVGVIFETGLQKVGHLKILVGHLLGPGPKAICTVLGGVQVYDRVNLNMTITQHHAHLISMRTVLILGF